MSKGFRFSFNPAALADPLYKSWTAEDFEGHPNVVLLGVEPYDEDDNGGQGNLLEKARPVKYLKRIPTGNPKHKYRYVYHVEGHGVVQSHELAEGARYAGTHKHEGKEHQGHWHVVKHDKETGQVTVRHTGSGQEQTMHHEQFAAHVNAQHAQAYAGRRESKVKEIETAIKEYEAKPNDEKQGKRVHRLIHEAAANGWLKPNEAHALTGITNRVPEQAAHHEINAGLNLMRQGKGDHEATRQAIERHAAKGTIDEGHANLYREQHGRLAIAGPGIKKLRDAGFEVEDKGAGRFVLTKDGVRQEMSVNQRGAGKPFMWEDSHSTRDDDPLPLAMEQHRRIVREQKEKAEQEEKRRKEAIEREPAVRALREKQAKEAAGGTGGDEAKLAGHLNPHLIGEKPGKKVTVNYAKYGNINDLGQLEGYTTETPGLVVARNYGGKGWQVAHAGSGGLVSGGHKTKESAMALAHHPITRKMDWTLPDDKLQGSPALREFGMQQEAIKAQIAKVAAEKKAERQKGKVLVEKESTRTTGKIINHRMNVTLEDGSKHFVIVSVKKNDIGQPTMTTAQIKEAAIKEARERSGAGKGEHMAKAIRFTFDPQALCASDPLCKSRAVGFPDDEATVPRYPHVPGERIPEGAVLLGMEPYADEDEDEPQQIDLLKAQTHKYLRRVPTGNPARKWRYIYHLPGHGVVTSDHLKEGARFKGYHEHEGIKHEGHYEVVSHDKDTGHVTVKHTGSGQTVKMHHEEFARHVNSQHAGAHAEKKAGKLKEIEAALDVLNRKPGDAKQRARVEKLIHEAAHGGWLGHEEAHALAERAKRGDKPAPARNTKAAFLPKVPPELRSFAEKYVSDALVESGMAKMVMEKKSGRYGDFVTIKWMSTPGSDQKKGKAMNAALDVDGWRYNETYKNWTQPIDTPKGPRGVSDLMDRVGRDLVHPWNKVRDLLIEYREGKDLPDVSSAPDEAALTPKEEKIYHITRGWNSSAIRDREAGYHRGEIIYIPAGSQDPLAGKYLKVLSASSRYIHEDGLSMGLGDDQGWLHTATVREATPEEAAPEKSRQEKAKKEREQKAAHKQAVENLVKEIVEKGENLGNDIASLADIPDIEKGAETLVVDPGVHGSGRQVVYIGKKRIWSIHWGYYDDYRRSVHSIPKTPEMVEKIRELATGPQKEEPMHKLLPRFTFTPDDAMHDSALAKAMTADVTNGGGGGPNLTDAEVEEAFRAWVRNRARQWMRGCCCDSCDAESRAGLVTSLYDKAQEQRANCIYMAQAFRKLGDRVRVTIENEVAAVVPADFTPEWVTQRRAEKVRQAADEAAKAAAQPMGAVPPVVRY